MRYRPGQVLLHRGFHHEQLQWVTANRVVHHDDRGVLLWRVAGSPFVGRRAKDGRSARDMPFREWLATPTELVHRVWSGPSVLTLVRPGAAHSVWGWFEEGAFTGWYVNLEEPSVLWSDGVDFCDQDLDIVVRPDRTWGWKDEADFTSRLAFREYWVRDPAAVRAEGLRVIGDIEAGRFPFDGTWSSFAPPTDWSVPTALPVGWDRPRQR